MKEPLSYCYELWKLEFDPELLLYLAELHKNQQCPQRKR